MALGDAYATLAELKARLGITDTADDARLTAALNTASRGIDHCCGRQFNDAGTASARVFVADTLNRADVDDFHSITGLIIATDTGNDGTYETVWAASDYELYPLGGVVEGETGWPYWQIRAVGSRQFPAGTPGRPAWRSLERAPVQVTARWGWAAVPAPIKEATLVIASEIFKLRDAPFGVAGFGDWGPVRVRANPIAYAMIRPYERYPVLVA